MEVVVGGEERSQGVQSIQEEVPWAVASSKGAAEWVQGKAEVGQALEEVVE